MPKENTHLYFADRVEKKLNDAELKRVLKKNRNSYFVGAVIPDAFLFSLDKENEKYSDIIHGSASPLSSQLIFSLIDSAKIGKKEEDLAFILGLLTHLALDQIFHPVIISLTGDLKEKDPSKLKVSVFKHRYWETYLDKMVNKNFLFKNLVQKKFVQDIPIFSLFCRELGISKRKAIKIFGWQVYINGILGNRRIYYFALILCKINIIVKDDHIRLLEMNLKSFEDLEKEEKTIPSIIYYRDAMTGEQKSTTVEKLFNEAYALGVKYIVSAFDYCHKE